MRNLQPEKPEGKKNWMTMAELAKFLNVHRDTIKLGLKEGRFPEAECRTNKGWRLWSPEQVSEILRKRSRSG